MTTLPNPSALEELLFRIEAILRRTVGSNVAQEVYQLGKYKFDTQKQQLINEETGDVAKLTTKESELLKLLCINTNKVLERNFALKTIWVDDNYFMPEVWMLLTKLRKQPKKNGRVLCSPFIPMLPRGKGL